MAAATKVSCFLCSSFAGSSFTDVIRHIGAIHSCDSDFQITCGLDGCSKQYRNFGSYKVHLYRSHRDILKGFKTPQWSLLGADEEVSTNTDRPDGECQYNNANAQLSIRKLLTIYDCNVT